MRQTDRQQGKNEAQIDKITGFEVFLAHPVVQLSVRHIHSMCRTNAQLKTPGALRVCVCACVRLRVCVCERDREREREKRGEPVCVVVCGQALTYALWNVFIWSRRGTLTSATSSS